MSQRNINVIRFFLVLIVVVIGCQKLLARDFSVSSYQNYQQSNAQEVSDWLRGIQGRWSGSGVTKFLINSEKTVVRNFKVKNRFRKDGGSWKINSERLREDRVRQTLSNMISFSYGDIYFDRLLVDQYRLSDNLLQFSLYWRNSPNRIYHRVWQIKKNSSRRLEISEDLYLRGRLIETTHQVLKK